MVRAYSVLLRNTPPAGHGVDTVPVHASIASKRQSSSLRGVPQLQALVLGDDKIRYTHSIYFLQCTCRGTTNNWRTSATLSPPLGFWILDFPTLSLSFSFSLSSTQVNFSTGSLKSISSANLFLSPSCPLVSRVFVICDSGLAASALSLSSLPLPDLVSRHAFYSPADVTAPTTVDNAIPLSRINGT